MTYDYYVKAAAQLLVGSKVLQWMPNEDRQRLAKDLEKHPRLTLDLARAILTKSNVYAKKYKVYAKPE